MTIRKPHKRYNNRRSGSVPLSASGVAGLAIPLTSRLSLSVSYRPGRPDYQQKERKAAPSDSGQPLFSLKRECGYAG